jgi:hypothetical protein
MAPPSDRNPQDTSRALGGLIGIGVLVYMGYMFWGGGLEREADKTMDDIHHQVVADSLAQYKITKQSGAPIDSCVQAGLVAASYLQAQDQANYAKWKRVEGRDCEAAGIPR